MASLNFSLQEALNILWANGMLSKNINDIKAQKDGLLVTVAGGIDIMVQIDSFSQGVLKLAFASKSWAFKLADSFGKVDKKIDAAIQDFPFIRREGKLLFINLNNVLESKVKGIQIKNFQLRDGSIQIEFY